MGQASSQPTAASQQATPPASCPMHTQSSAAAPATASSSKSAPAQCPISHSSASSSSSSSSPVLDAQRPAHCPIKHAPSSADSQINPLNQMPILSQSVSPSQSVLLPTERTTSSIPRSETEAGDVWEYPSPQQFHNALLRKGMQTPEEHVEMMVQIHNFLNERAWDEVLRWERRRDETASVELARFQGRPGELSPKARFWLFAGWLLPARFNTEPPFDRHDWIVKRRTTGEEVRYVIDYYSAPPEPDGSPCFSLDVRPALDSVGSAKERIAVATEEAWTNWKSNQNRNERT